MNPIIKEFLGARKSDDQVILEGFHPIKHALRFGAGIEKIYTNDFDNLQKLIQTKSPDLTDQFQEKIQVIDNQVYNQLSKHPPKTSAIAIAQKPEYFLEKILQQKGRIVFLENVRSLDNLGAVIRVCAARGIQAVLMSGTFDPFHSTCLRASRGLHFAIPVIKISEFPQTSKSIIVFDENGKSLKENNLQEDAILVFGSERVGVSESIKKNTDQIISIPMRSKVSSLNLATSVAIAIYS